MKVFLFQTLSERAIVHPKMERNYATEYLTAEKRVSKSLKWLTQAIKVQSPDNTATIKVLQIG